MEFSRGKCNTESVYVILRMKWMLILRIVLEECDRICVLSPYNFWLEC